MDSFLGLPRKFSKARLDLELLATPLAGRAIRGTDDIVQIDIATRNKSAQRFRLYPGAAENRIEVLGADAPRRQLVLFIDEPRRRFEVSVRKNVPLAPATRVLRETATARVVEQFTTGRKRHFLCGMDEQHLFIAELPEGASSTHGAREALRNPGVPSSLKLRGEAIVRQGEWFFVPLSTAERALVEALAARGGVVRQSGIAQAAHIPRAGRPHVADEIVLRSWERGLPDVFVRGEIRHPDHQTVILREFRRALPNRERFDRPEGVFWVD